MKKIGIMIILILICASSRAETCYTYYNTIQKVNDQFEFVESRQLLEYEIFNDKETAVQFATQNNLLSNLIYDPNKQQYYVFLEIPEQVFACVNTDNK